VIKRGARAELEKENGKSSNSCRLIAKRLRRFDWLLGI